MKILSIPISETEAKVCYVCPDSTQIAILDIELLPEPEEELGKYTELYINPTTNELYYKYIDKPLNEDSQILASRLEETERNNALMLLAMVEGGLM